MMSDSSEEWGSDQGYAKPGRSLPTQLGLVDKRRPAYSLRVFTTPAEGRKPKTTMKESIESNRKDKED